VLIALCAIIFDPCLPWSTPATAGYGTSISLGFGTGYRRYYGAAVYPSMNIGFGRVWGVPRYSRPYYRPYYAPYYGRYYYRYRDYDRYADYDKRRDSQAEERNQESVGYQGPVYVPPRYIPPRYIPPRYIHGSRHGTTEPE
jgi:hypothetical protein